MKGKYQFDEIFRVISNNPAVKFKPHVTNVEDAVTHVNGDEVAIKRKSKYLSVSIRSNAIIVI